MADTGLLQFLDWGTADTISASVGKVTGGNLDADSALVHREAIGAQDDIEGGPVPIGGNADLILQDGTLIGYALRSAFTSPSLTALCFAGGDNVDGRKQTGCKINTLRLGCSVGEAATASIAWLGLADAAYTTAAQSYLTDYSFEWYSATASINSASLNVTSWEVNVNNNLEHIWHLDTTTENQRRWPDEIKIGSQNVTLGIDCLVHQPSTIINDIIADSLATDITASFTVLGGASKTETLTVSLTNLSRRTAPIPFVVGGGLVSYRMEFEAPNDTDCITVSVA